MQLQSWLDLISFLFLKEQFALLALYKKDLLNLLFCTLQKEQSALLVMFPNCSLAHFRDNHSVALFKR